MSQANSVPRTLPIPDFYDPMNAEKWSYAPDRRKLAEAASEFRVDQNVAPAAKDSLKVQLVLIDLQRDFCYPEGALFAAGRSGTGAVDDNKRIAEFIYRNLEVVTGVTTTLDTHFVYQIFTPAFWLFADGSPVPPHTIISSDMILKGEVKVDPIVVSAIPGLQGNYTWLQKQVIHYCQELEKAGKYELYIWPEHCEIGSDGHPLSGVIYEARTFLSAVRGSQSDVETKGGNPLTENYSVFSPEVLTRHDGKGALAQKNTRLIETLIKNDRVIFAGQASSHCVKASVEDFVTELLAQDPELASKCYILEDCMSAVTVPDGQGGFIADFTEDAEKALERYRDHGMHVVKSTDPVEDWADFMSV